MLLSNQINYEEDIKSSIQDIPLLNRAILAGIIANQNKNLAERVFEILEPKDFIDPYKEVAEIIKKLLEENITPDLVTMAAKSKTAKELCIEFMNMDFFSLYNDESMLEKARMLKNERIKYLLSNAYANGLDIEIVKQKLAQLEKDGSAKYFDRAELLSITDDLFQKQAEQHLMYPFALINRATRGISKGQYVVVAGRPSVGKSTFLDNVAEFIARKGKKVLFASAEMSAEMITLRIMSRLMQVNMFDPMKMNMIKPLDYAEAREKFPNVNIFSFSNVTQLEQSILENKADYDCIFVDYLQQIEPKRRYKSMYEKTTFVSGELKQMAIRFGIPFIVASQFSRIADKQQPTMSDLKDSGAIEQDADVIISLWKDKTDAENDPDMSFDETLQKTRVDILKNRNGFTYFNTDGRDYSLMFKKDQFRFFEVTPVEVDKKKKRK